MMDVSVKKNWAKVWIAEAVVEQKCGQWNIIASTLKKKSNTQYVLLPYSQKHSDKNEKHTPKPEKAIILSDKESKRIFPLFFLQFFIFFVHFDNIYTWPWPLLCLGQSGNTNTSECLVWKNSSLIMYLETRKRKEIRSCIVIMIDQDTSCSFIMC